ncbi:hypothetical protein R1flu_023392 [Riccia fluitans]|uniref:Pentatricopeptide repeat-containing protein n=1 Tax=Riccia fluitans TaxID=41844 RepID=A0ABD1XRX9_9MARC
MKCYCSRRAYHSKFIDYSIWVFHNGSDWTRRRIDKVAAATLKLNSFSQHGTASLLSQAPDDTAWHFMEMPLQNSALPSSTRAVDDTLGERGSSGNDTEVADRNTNRVLGRKSSLPFLTSGNFSTFQRDTFPGALRRCFSAVHNSIGELREENVDGNTPPGNHQVQMGSTIEDQSVNMPELVRKINCTLSSDNWEEALDQLELSTPLIAEVIRRQGSVNRALEFFEWVRDRRCFQHSARTYKVMLYKLMSSKDSKSKKLETINQLINQCLTDGFSPGVTIHTNLVDAYCRAGNLEGASEHMRLMEVHGCPPNVVTYSSMINGFIRARRVDCALKLLEEMESKNCEPNVVTYSAVIHGLVKDRRMREAWKVFDKMKDRGCVPNLITYSCIIDGLANLGQYEEISSLVDEMRQAGCTPNLFIYSILINYCVKVGTLDRAWELFSRMKEDGLTPNLFIFTPIISSLGKAGELEQAQRLLKEMVACGCYPDVVTFSALIVGLMKAGKWEEACQILADMDRYNCPPNTKTYSSLIAGLVKLGEITKAESLMQEMIARGYMPPFILRQVFEKRAVEPVEA